MARPATTGVAREPSKRHEGVERKQKKLDGPAMSHQRAVNRPINAGQGHVCVHQEPTGSDGGLRQGQQAFVG